MASIRACCRSRSTRPTPQPKQVLPRIPHEAHEMNWVDAIKGQAGDLVPFEYAAQLTEVMLLGVVSLRAGGEDSLRRGEPTGHQQDKVGKQ